MVADGEQGQVAVSMDSPEAFAGYWNRPDADAKSIRDGWYFTGDLATTDEDGDLWVSGRVDDMINSGGENIYPEEIENALARCPDLDEVIVVGTPDDKWGHAVTAFVVGPARRRPPTTLAKVEAYVRDAPGCPSMKRPKRIVVVERIPVPPSARPCADTWSTATSRRSPTHDTAMSAARPDPAASRTPPC